jgi:KaiC/GvpD/RAD55 family RecA-like ATPase
MGFKKMTRQVYPPRLWGIKGYPGSGKTTFAVQMRGPLLVVDADHRFQEVLDLAGEQEVYELSDAPADNVSADRIAARLTEGMPGSEIGTIVVDSLTAIIMPLVVQAMQDKEHGRAKNLAAAFRTKALAMRQLQDAVTRWGTDCLWIYHLNDARDAQGKELTQATVSKTELARLMRSINLQLEIVQDSGRRGVRVVWARRGRSELTLWDETGFWRGMPERIEEAVYAGLSRAEQEEIESRKPAVFPNAETAIAWGLEQGAFEALQHARNAYDKLKREAEPETAREMAALWTADVARRLAEAATGARAEGAEEHVADGEAA